MISQIKNTFQLSCIADKYARVESHRGLEYILERVGEDELFILGGGSNIVLPTELKRFVIEIDIKGIEIRKHEDYTLVKVGAGEVWHDLVKYSVEHNLRGLENLALIPGKCGAAPVQNIGAYGVELKDVLYSVEAYDLELKKFVFISNEECELAYRNSIFKRKVKGRYIITGIQLKLNQKESQVNTSYRALASYFEEKNIANPGQQDVFDAVIAIRKSKLPDPRELGNAGSFFKNPVSTLRFAKCLENDFGHVPYFEFGDDLVKIPAAWLIEKCGLKGKRFDEVSCHEKQPLIIVNHGHAKQKQVVAHVRRIIQTVRDKFSIELEPEVQIIKND